MNEAVRNWKESKTVFAGAGALVQLVGVIALFFFPIGTLIGIVLLIMGSVMARKTICANCGNRIEKTSRLCPHCGVEFGG